ncbi:MAG: hypothetical protein U1U88_001291 [Lawsonella clevelandensis]
MHTASLGSLICEEATRRGHDVTAIVRRNDPVNAQATIVKDALDLYASDLAGSDVVVDALGFFTPETLPLHSTSLKHIADCLAGTNTRLLVVGGAGSLTVDDKGTTLDDTPEFPDDFKPLAKAMARASLSFTNAMASTGHTSAQQQISKLMEHAPTATPLLEKCSPPTTKANRT